MSATTPDTLRLKTDDELRFFVANPQFYQEELVAAARRELQRRGVSPTGSPNPAGAPPPADNYDAYHDEPTRRPVLTWLLVLAGGLLLGAVGYAWHSANRATSQQLAAASAAKLSPDSLKLESVATAPLPQFDVERDISRQLALVPAAELKQVSAQQLRQYRAVSRRFWEAEHPTEFIVQAARTGQAPSYSLLAGQISLTEALWHTAGNALVYTYKLPPTMADQLERMRAAAGPERRTLESIKQLCQANKPLHLGDKAQTEHAAAQELLEGLRRPPRIHTIHL